MRAATTSYAGGFQPVLALWLLLGWIGFALVPWYGLDSNFFTFSWLARGYPFNEKVAPALFLIAQGKKLWLAPFLLLLLAPLALYGRAKSDPLFSKLLIIIGALGIAWFFIEGYAIGLRGWRYEWLNGLFGELGDRQFGMGYGAMLTACAFLFLMCLGFAARGLVGGDVFVVSSIG
ncbi:iron ABC transporter permease, partial [Salmonella enterica subsp. enterica]|nr:iron ABC transporter permease [Salmonella enterica subsp. enterica serovar Enteritidis]